MGTMNPADPARRPVRLAVLISGSGTTLANLVERIRSGRLAGVQIGLVISSRGQVRGVEVARAAGLPLAIIRRRDYPDDWAFSDAITAALDRAGVDLVAMGGFLCLWHLPPRYAGRALNIHPALLPRFGGPGMHGRHVHAAVLAAGEKESGCTVHLVDEQYDHGPIVAQRRVPVLPGDTPERLAERVMAAERELYPEVLRQIAEHGLAWLAEKGNEATRQQGNEATRQQGNQAAAQGSRDGRP
jgi:formyltetrahydrofolate-dependent phosphoribosylglycinamide formyltransferase